MNALSKLEDIKTVPASIVFDFEAVKTRVVAHLERYSNIILTEDTFKEGKELIKEINSTRKALDTARKDEVKKASEPIKAFEANMKELVSLHDTLLNNLREQISKFENEQKEKIRLSLVDYQNEQWETQGVREEFRKSQIDHLVLLGSFTKGEKLTAKAAGEVKQLVSNDFALQAQTDLRISQLEAACYKAGLAAPLTKNHIQHFIFDDEVTYQTKLNSLLQSELDREKRAVAHRNAQRLAQEAAAKQAEEQREQAYQSHQQQAEQSQTYQVNTEEPAAYNAAPIQQQQSNSNRVVVTCSFELRLPAHITNEVIASQLDAKLKAAGFTTHTITGINRG